MTYPSRQAESLAMVLLLLLGARTCCANGTKTSEADSARPRLVVVLYPQNSDGSPGYFLVDQSIRTTFAASSSEHIDIYNEYLDIARLKSRGEGSQREYLKRKYEHRHVDLVIAGLSPALDFALDNRDVFSNAPIVFCTVDLWEIESRQLPPDVIGAPSRFDLEATLKLALRLHPETENVAVIAGCSDMDIHWERKARQIFSPYEDRLKFIYLSGLPRDELLDRVSALPEKTIVYYLHVFQDGSGRVLVPSHVLEHLAQKSNAPIYGHVDTYVGRGAVGGVAFRFAAEGETAARLGLRILRGEPPEDIGIQPSNQNVEMFDWRQFRRWNIDPAALPAESIILFREPTFWELYHRQLIGTAALVIVQTILIAGLLVQRHRWKRAENRFRQAVESAPNGMLMVNRNGIIVLTNPYLENLFGYAPSELKGQPVEMLIPETLRAEPADQGGLWFRIPENPQKATDREIAGIRKDGTEIAIAVGWCLLRTSEGLFVLASIVDITESRRVLEDLRTSKKQLRQLSLRLIKAQEQERRRIARELHDDFNQTLAFVAVKLDLLRQKPPERAEFQARLEELSAQVKDISSSLHELSHELHPLKLEQLGLVTAIRGLCHELSESHALKIDFQTSEVPAAIAPETGLCLYRIAQESLRNAIKHSGAQEARIRLTGDGSDIHMEVEDRGAGFDPETARAQAGLGFVSMRERLRLVGGELAVRSQPGSGTTIRVRVPLERSAQNQEQEQSALA